MSASPGAGNHRSFPWPVLGPKLFAANDDTAEPIGVILWWERRRLAYNVFVCIAGIAGMLAWTTLDQRYGDACVGDMAAFQMIGGFVAANVCYTGGWVFEVVLRCYKRPPATLAPRLLVAGIAFSLVVTALPSVMVLIDMALHVPPATGASC